MDASGLENGIGIWAMGGEPAGGVQEKESLASLLDGGELGELPGSHVEELREDEQFVFLQGGIVDIREGESVELDSCIVQFSRLGVHTRIDLRTAFTSLDGVVIAALPVRNDGDFRAGAEVLDGIVNWGDLMEELQDFGAIIPVAAEIVVPVGASFADGLRQIARKHGDTFLNRIGQPEPVFHGEMSAGIRFENAHLVVEGIGGPQAACKLRIAQFAHAVAAGGCLEIDVG